MNHLNKIKIVGFFAVASFSQFLRPVRLSKWTRFPLPGYPLLSFPGSYQAEMQPANHGIHHIIIIFTLSGT
jgi:hypothetical protein